MGRAFPAIYAVCALTASALGQTFYERDGLLVIEVEQAPAISDWRVETKHAGFAGQSYYRWTGANYMGGPPSGHELAYRIHITNPGTYRFRWHNRHEHPDGTLENDHWVQMDNGTWYKTYSGRSAVWTWITVHETHDVATNTSYDLSAGPHTFRVRPRSSGMAIDRIVLHKEEIHGADVNWPESPTSATDDSFGLGEVLRIDGRALDLSAADYTVQALWVSLPAGTRKGSVSFPFAGPEGTYYIHFTPVLESAGRSAYRIRVNGNQAGEHQAGPGDKAVDIHVDHTWSIPNVFVPAGATIEVEGEAVSSSDGSIWPGAKWQRVQFTQIVKPGTGTTGATRPTPLRVMAPRARPRSWSLIGLDGRALQMLQPGALAVRALPEPAPRTSMLRLPQSR